MYEFVGTVVLILGLVGAGLMNRHLRETKQLKLRQILQEERLKAMEHSTPLPETDDAELIEQIFGHSGGPVQHAEHAHARAVLWVRMTALCVGLASVFGGFAVVIGFYLVKDPEFSNYWAMGLIPILMGIGLLLFYFMSRSFARLPVG